MNTRYSPQLEQSEDNLIEPEFQHLFTTVGNFLAVVADTLGVPPVEVAAVVTDDYCGEVERTWASSTVFEDGQSGNYTVERVGGIAVAKTIPVAHDRSRFRIIFNRAQVGPLSDPAVHAKAVLLVAHEAAWAFSALFLASCAASGAKTTTTSSGLKVRWSPTQRHSCSHQSSFLPSLVGCDLQRFVACYSAVFGVFTVCVGVTAQRRCLLAAGAAALRSDQC